MKGLKNSRSVYMTGHILLQICSKFSVFEELSRRFISLTTAKVLVWDVFKVLERVRTI